MGVAWLGGTTVVAGLPWADPVALVWSTFGGRDVLWLGIGCLMIGCGGYHSVGLVRRVEVRGCMDN